MGRPKLSQKNFEERIKKRFPLETFKILSYDSLGQPLVIQCSGCQNFISISKASNFLAPNKRFGCVKCHGFYLEREEKIKQISERYTILDSSVVKNTHKIYTIKCKKCGHIRKTYLNNIFKNLSCGCETGVFRRTHEDFEKEVKRITSGACVLVSTFSTMLEKVKIRHLSCGMIFEIRPSDFLYTERWRCPKCNPRESQGERLVSEILMNNQIPFEREVYIPENKQFFDFFLPHCLAAIEYHGSQHYQMSSLFHSGTSDFQKQQENDERKRQYCKNNNIYLLETPYFLKKQEVETLILTFLERFND